MEERRLGVSTKQSQLRYLNNKFRVKLSHLMYVQVLLCPYGARNDGSRLSAEVEGSRQINFCTGFYARQIDPLFNGMRPGS